MSMGFYRGDKSAFLADAMRINGAAMPPMRTLAPMLPGSEAAEMGAAAVMTIGVTDVGPALMSRKHAEQMGYTGDACDHCGSMKMQRTGHCNTCAECGTTTGCS